eukprot:gene23760-32146_t
MGGLTFLPFVREGRVEKKEEKKKEAVAAAPVVPESKTLPTPPTAADPSKAPKQPVLPPTYTTPAPAKKSPSGTIAAKEFVWKEGEPVDLTALNAQLSQFSYVAGYLPGKVDLRVKAAVTSVDDSLYPNVARWLRNIVSFSEEDAKNWA